MQINKITFANIAATTFLKKNATTTPMLNFSSRDEFVRSNPQNDETLETYNKVSKTFYRNLEKTLDSNAQRKGVAFTKYMNHPLKVEDYREYILDKDAAKDTIAFFENMFFEYLPVDIDEADCKIFCRKKAVEYAREEIEKARKELRENEGNEEFDANLRNYKIALAQSIIEAYEE